MKESVLTCASNATLLKAQHMLNRRMSLRMCVVLLHVLWCMSQPLPT